MRIRPPVLALASTVALAGFVAAGAALAQPVPPPGAEAPVAAVAPPPLPGDVAMAPPPRGHGAPPPPGAHVIVDRGANGFVHVDVKCAERESTQECAGIPTRMLDKLGTDAKGR